MYLPKHFEENDLTVLHQLLRAHPLAALVTFDGAGLAVNHLPLLLDPAAGACGTLRGHVARANTVWQKISCDVESVAIFQGPEAYISPSWYPGKHQHGKAVPTWNYAVVHTHGFPRAIEDKEWLLAHVSALSDVHEAGQAVPWKVSDAPADFIDSMLEAIVGIEMPIVRITGKWKVSQNRPSSDRLGVVAGLGSRQESGAQSMAALVRQAMNAP